MYVYVSYMNTHLTTHTFRVYNPTVSKSYRSKTSKSMWTLHLSRWWRVAWKLLAREDHREDRISALCRYSTGFRLWWSSTRWGRWANIGTWVWYCPLTIRMATPTCFWVLEVATQAIPCARWWDYGCRMTTGLPCHNANSARAEILIRSNTSNFLNHIFPTLQTANGSSKYWSSGYGHTLWLPTTTGHACYWITSRRLGSLESSMLMPSSLVYANACPCWRVRHPHRDGVMITDNVHIFVDLGVMCSYIYVYVRVYISATESNRLCV